VQDFNVYSLLESEWQDREKLKAKSLKLYIWGGIDENFWRVWNWQ
jgi:hypothetical protein